MFKMIFGICPICNEPGKLTEHHNPSKGILNEQIRKKAIDSFYCIDCHDKKGINAIERAAVKSVKKQGPFVTSTNDLNSLKKNLLNGVIPEFNDHDRFIVSAGTIITGEPVSPISGTEIRLISRNFYQKDNWKRLEYGWGIRDINSVEQLENIRAGSPYIAAGSPTGYYYNVDIAEQKGTISNM